MVYEPQITLFGRTSAWRPHRLVATAGRPSQHERHAAATSLLVTWLHHHTYGTLGVYATSETVVGEIKRQRREWVRLTGIVRPCLAYTLADDPRSGVDHDYTPLLLATLSVQPVATLPTVWEQPALTSTQPIRIASRQFAGSGSISAIVGWPDAVYWHTAQTQSLLFAEWNTVRGVVTYLGQHRYLRYVLSHKRASSITGTHHG